VLLDRRRVKFWQKIVFGFMAFLMAAFLVVGYSGVLNGCTWFNSTQEDAAKLLDQQLAKNKAATVATPTDPAAWTALADAYVSRSSTQTQGSAALTADLTAAAVAYAKADKLLAKQKGAGVKQQRLDILTKMGAAYASLGDAAAIERVYQSITELTPKDPQAFLSLGTAARSAGDTSTALMAFTRFLELDPQSTYAKDVKDAIAQLSPQSSPTPSPSPTK
jgi:tetratricopeptide (TPR) repeat protein